MLARWAPVVGVFLLAPVSAEYLDGYDQTTGDPRALIAGLLFFAPLYGGAALLVRETARRLGAGWPGIVLLAAAFGVIQAGLADQSLFSTDYRDIEYWREMIGPTYIPALGISGYTMVNFVGGHVIWSVCVPVALVESMVPVRRSSPWLGRGGLGTVAALYVGATTLITWGHLETEGLVLSRGQLVGTMAMITALVTAAVVAGRSRRSITSRTDAWVPRTVVVGAGALGLTLAHLWAFDWTSVLVSLGILAGTAVSVMWWSCSARWTGLHVVALAGGALLGAAVAGFLTVPIGEVSDVAKYAHNIVMMLSALAVVTVAAVSAARHDRRPKQPDSADESRARANEGGRV